MFENFSYELFYVVKLKFDRFEPIINDFNQNRETKTRFSDYLIESRKFKVAFSAKYYLTVGLFSSRERLKNFNDTITMTSNRLAYLCLVSSSRFISLSVELNLC